MKRNQIYHIEQHIERSNPHLGHMDDGSSNFMFEQNKNFNNINATSTSHIDVQDENLRRESFG